MSRSQKSHSEQKSKSDTNEASPDDGLTQSERFIKAAQELGTDDDPERFKERVRKLARADNGTSGAQQDQSHSDGKK